MSSSDEEKPSREYVESLMTKAPYKTSNLSTLEAYVDAQASGVLELLSFLDLIYVCVCNCG